MYTIMDIIDKALSIIGQNDRTHVVIFVHTTFQRDHFQEVLERLAVAPWRYDTWMFPANVHRAVSYVRQGHREYAYLIAPPCPPVHVPD
jgi:molecular chaperone GrpE (heat shock protein)